MDEFDQNREECRVFLVSWNNEAKNENKLQGKASDTSHIIRSPTVGCSYKRPNPQHSQVHLQYLDPDIVFCFDRETIATVVRYSRIPSPEFSRQQQGIRETTRTHASYLDNLLILERKPGRPDKLFHISALRLYPACRGCRHYSSQGTLFAVH